MERMIAATRSVWICSAARFRYQQLRVLHRRPCDTDPLALAARELVGARKGAEQGPEVAGVPEAPGQHVVHDPHAVDEVELLEDHADVAGQAAQLGLIPQPEEGLLA